MLTFTNRMNVIDRFKEYCSDHSTDYTPGVFLNWLGMMDLLNEDAIMELQEIKCGNVQTKKERNENKMPESVEEAMEYIKGYCMKHQYCESNGNTCRLYEKSTGRCFMCSDIVPADWEIDNGGKDGEQ